MKQNFDLSIYFVADPHACGGRDIAEVVMAAARGGVTVVQLRNKIDPKPLVAAQAAMLCELLKPYNIPFLVNDYVDIARDVGADGAHIGQGDITPAEARKILGEDAILGLTAFTEEQIGAVDPAVIDYIGTGPFFPTQTDKGKPVLGAEKFAALIKSSPVPVVGIGGITVDNAEQVLDAGANGLAMMRAISAADDPCEAAQEFAKLIER